MDKLADILRPQSLDEIIGQQHLVGDGCPIDRMKKSGVFQSSILHGPPGTGKTSIISALSKDTGAAFHHINATNSSVKELRSIIKNHEDDNNLVIFIDEIHRFNKSQQDVLLPYVEDGTLYLFGATTENPQFSVNSTILSRALVFETKPLINKDLVAVVKKVLKHYAKRNIKADRDALKLLLNRVNGDARKLITVLETLIEIMLDEGGTITSELLNMVMPNPGIVFDASGSEHYDYAHCYQEAIQHSQVDDSIYWLAKWLESGEDPAYISRRMLITAFEDCAGNPFAATTAMAAAFATERVGMPECAIPLALATAEMVTSKRNKSAYLAIKQATEDVRNGVPIQIPDSLKAGTSGYPESLIKKTYLAGFCKDWDALQKSPNSEKNVWDGVTTVFAVSNGKGYVAGPHPDIAEMQKHDGDDDWQIVQIREGHSDVPLYEWFMGRWEPAVNDITG